MEQESYKYYSTQRPIDIGTFPKSPDNPPTAILNYDCDARIPVEGGAFRAWGELAYDGPLSPAQIEDYELRPEQPQHSPDNGCTGTGRGQVGGEEPRPRGQAADVVVSRLRCICGKGVCHPGAACRQAQNGNGAASRPRGQKKHTQP